MNKSKQIKIIVPKKKAINTIKEPEIFKNEDILQFYKNKLAFFEAKIAK
jgi:hypothetical protein